VIRIFAGFIFKGVENETLKRKVRKRGKL